MRFTLKRFKNILVTVSLAIFSITSFAQETTKDSIPTTWQLLKYDGISAFKGLTTTYAKPLEWKKDDYLTAGAIVLGTGAMFLIDEKSSQWFMDQENDIPGLIKDVGWYYGSPQNNYAINGSVYLYGLFTKNKKIRKTGVLLISAASTAGLIQTFAKTAVGRARPGRGKGSSSFKPFSSEGGYHSFPSGHTILSFTTAYAIGKQFKNPYLKGGILCHWNDRSRITALGRCSLAFRCGSQYGYKCSGSRCDR